MLETLFGSKLRAKVLGWLYSHPDQRYFVRQLTAILNEDSTNVSRELARLEKIGILVSTTEGRQKYYQANPLCPVFNELKSLIRKDLNATPSLPAEEGSGDEVIARRFRVPKERLAEYCRRHHIKKLSLFGSVLRPDFQPDSDIDVLVEFEPGYVPGFAIIDMEGELSRLVGRKVDLRTAGDLSRYFRDRVVRESRLEYSIDS
jgi:predicted nucleotidyltransferase